jgi:hypothetical protein
MQGELAVRFSNVYDAYSYLDMDGDWNLSANEFVVGLRKLRIDTAHLRCASNKKKEQGSFTQSLGLFYSFTKSRLTLFRTSAKS